MSLSETNDIRAKDGVLTIEPFLKRIPKNEEAMEILKKNIEANDMVYGNMVFKGFQGCGNNAYT